MKNFIREWVESVVENKVARRFKSQSATLRRHKKAISDIRTTEPLWGRKIKREMEQLVRDIKSGVPGVEESLRKTVNFLIVEHDQSKSEMKALKQRVREMEDTLSEAKVVALRKEA